MSLKIRLLRRGKKNTPFYHLVLADAKSKRSSCKRKLGFYNPLANENKLSLLDPLALKKYMSCGAQPTDRVKFLLKKIGFDANFIESEAIVTTDKN